MSPESARPPRPSRPGVTFRKWNRILHRDLGYLAAGLTLVYAVSGVAVNHIQDFNPNYRIRHDTATVALSGTPEEVSRAALRAFGIGGEPRGTFQPDPNALRIFVKDGTVEVDLSSGEAVLETASLRPILAPANFLHLNTARGLWTWVADAFAVVLALLALTGLFMIKGKKGLGGRGKWLTAAGVLIPLAFLALLYRP